MTKHISSTVTDSINYSNNKWVRVELGELVEGRRGDNKWTEAVFLSCYANIFSKDLRHGADQKNQKIVPKIKLIHFKQFLANKSYIIFKLPQ